MTLEPTQPPVNRVPGEGGVKQLGRELDHSPLPSTEIKNAWSYTSTPTIRLHGMVPDYAEGLTSYNEIKKCEKYSSCELLEPKRSTKKKTFSLTDVPLSRGQQ
jgi:hypothetical protein